MRNTDKLLSVFSRFRGSTPPFWKKVRLYCIIAGTMAGAIIGANEGGLHFPEFLVNASQYILLICGTIGITAQTTTDVTKP